MFLHMIVVCGIYLPTAVNSLNYKLEEAGTHKSAKNHAGEIPASNGKQMGGNLCVGHYRGENPA